MSGDGWSQRAGRRVACVGIGSRRGVCSALASQRSLSLGHAGQGAMAPSCSRSRYLTALGVSRVSMLRSRVCVAAIDRGARSASVRAVLPWSWRGGPHPLMARPPPPTFIRHWRGGPHPLMARPPPPTFIRPPPKICRSEKSRSDSRKFCRHALPRSCPGTIPFSRRRSLWQR